jgi:hypothetical protein
MSTILRRGSMILLVLPLVGLAACGELRERSLCDQYTDFQAAVAQVQDLDPGTATADDIRSIADDVLGELDQLQSAADGQYDVLISNLRASLTVLREAAVDLGPTGIDVARPLLRDAWDDVVADYRLLTQRLDVVCPPD